MPGIYDDFLADLDAPLGASIAQRVRRMLSPASEPGPAPPGISLDRARAELRRRMVRYALAPFATSKFLAALPAGTGKTTIAVWLAEALARRGMQVAYIMPRHDFFYDILDASRHNGGEPDRWFHWLPRQTENKRHGSPETCHITKQMQAWTERGNRAIKFCQGVCGFDYINGGIAGDSGCIYHQQARDAMQPLRGLPQIIAMQHNHIVTDHPLLKNCDIVIGDESPLMSFCHPWRIPISAISQIDWSPDTDATRAMGNICTRLAGLVGRIKPDDIVEGSDLYSQLGGAAVIADLAGQCPTMPLDVSISNADKAEDSPYQFYSDLVRLMRIETRAILTAGACVPRIRLSTAGLDFFLRHGISQHLPPKIIWLDATADEDLYHHVTGWPIEVYAPHVAIPGPIYQVYDTLNTKGTAIDDHGVSDRSHDRSLVIDEIIKAQGYERPLIVSYSELASVFKRHTFTYFYANRGTNAYKDCDAVIIYGTPQLPGPAIERAAAMLDQARTQPYAMTYSDSLVSYPGQPFAYPTPGYWQEPAMHNLLQMIREDEIVQSAHRVRPILSVKPIWLLTGIPIPQLPPIMIMTTLEAMCLHLPERQRAALLRLGITAAGLCQALAIGRAELHVKSYVTHLDLSVQMEINEKTARRYLRALGLYDADAFPPLAISARGHG